MVAYTQRPGDSRHDDLPRAVSAHRRETFRHQADDVGHHAMWSRDGNTLFHVPGAQLLTAVRVVRKGTSLSLGEPQDWPGKLAHVNPFGAPRNFDISLDGNYEATTTRPAPLRRCKAEWDLLPLALEYDFLPIG